MTNAATLLKPSPRRRTNYADPALLARLTLPEPGRCPPDSWMREQLPALLNRWFAFGAFVGYRRKRRQRELCLVVLTSDKHTPVRSSGITAIPSHVRWRDGKQAFHLPTDVIQVPPEFEQQAGTVFGPGDATAAGGKVASVGAVVHHANVGLCLTTAGHLFSGSGSTNEVQVRSGMSQLACRVIEKRQQGSVDYALLRPTAGGQLDNLFRDQVRIGPAYTPGTDDLRRTVYLMHGDGGLLQARCTGVNGHFNSTQGSYRNLILTDAISDDGHSGGALVDAKNRLWGFLLGRFGNDFSFYVPADIVFGVAGVTLFQG